MTEQDNKTEEPKLALSLEKERQTVAGRFRPFLWMSALVATGVIAVFFYEIENMKPSGSIVGIAVEESVVRDKGRKIDQVDLTQKMAIEAAFSQYTAKLEPVDIKDNQTRDAYLATDYYKKEEKIATWSSLEKGERSLVAIQLWDNYDEDGDVVSVQSDGVTVVVPITHKPALVYIPHKTGSPLIIGGVQDGGGGITAAIETQSGPIPLPIMGVGQVLILPVF